MSILNRTIELIRLEGFTMRQVETEADIPIGYISKANTQTQTLNSERVEIIFNTLEKMIYDKKRQKINPYWYLTGKGSRFTSAYKVVDEEIVVNEESEQYDFEHKLIVALDNKVVQKKIREMLVPE